MNLAKKVTKEFNERFGGIPQTFMSPGRINIIGDIQIITMDLCFPQRLNMK
jgi:galactokinase